VYADYIGVKAGRHTKVEGNDLTLTELSVLLVYILIGNFIGAGIVGSMVSFCMPETREAAIVLMQNKEAVSIGGLLVKGVFCGCLMQIAFISNCGKPSIEGFLVAVLCIMGFILAGFEHSIADIAYAFIALQWTWKTALLIGAAVVGNLIGGHFTWLQLDR
jgi:formate/nitrite transporter FocA (FNT family)